MTRLTQADELRIGIAIARDDFDLIEVLTEAELALALRHQAQELRWPQFLLALANALDDPSAEYRLKLVRSRRGAPTGRSTIERDLAIAQFVSKQVEQGVKQEAAIAEVRAHFAISRATAMKALAEGRKLEKFAEGLKAMPKPKKPGESNQ